MDGTWPLSDLVMAGLLLQCAGAITRQQQIWGDTSLVSRLLLPHAGCQQDSRDVVHTGSHHSLQGGVTAHLGWNLGLHQHMCRSVEWQPGRREGTQKSWFSAEAAQLARLPEAPYIKRYMCMLEGCHQGLMCFSMNK